MLFLLNKKVFREKHVYNPHNKVFKNVLLGTSIKKKTTNPYSVSISPLLASWYSIGINPVRSQRKPNELTNHSLRPNTLINQSAKSTVTWAAYPKYSISLYLFLSLLASIPLSTYWHTLTLTCSHTRCASLTIVGLKATDITGIAWIIHWCSCFFRARAVQSFGITLPLPPLPLSLPLTHPASPSSFPSYYRALPGDDFTLWKRAAAAAKTMVATLR